jgi:thymidylate synthase ThyX
MPASARYGLAMTESSPDPLVREIQSRFFSRTEPQKHADIYLVRKLPQEIRATLNGLYSRSHLSMRDTFIKRLQQGLEDAGQTLADLPLAEAGEDALSQLLVDRSGKFLRTYAIDHGHNSLREGAVLQLAIENVSQLVTRFIQRERRASFEESSTRYISFSRGGHWRDPEVMTAGEPWKTLYEEALDESFSFYQECMPKLRETIERLRPRAEDEDEKAYARAVRAEAFDSARYLLTPALLTKFGMVADARTVSDVVSQLLSHPLQEFRIVGEKIRAEAEKEVPTLLAHAKPKDYLQSTHERLEALSKSRTRLEPINPEEVPQPSRINVRLISCPDDVDARLLASLIYEHSSEPWDVLHARMMSLDAEARAETYEQVLEKRGSWDAMPEGFEGAGLFDFEILMDFGAFRDIARHRKGFQQQQRLTTEHGFVVPELFEEAGLAPRYTAVMQSVAAKKRQLRECFPHAASYVIPFAFLQRVRVQFDVRQMAYFCELRSAPEGHFSYREVAIRMGKILRERAPLYSRWIQVCEERVFLGRVESEQQRDERRASREARAREKGFET